MSSGRYWDFTGKNTIYTQFNRSTLVPSVLCLWSAASAGSGVSTDGTKTAFVPSDPKLRAHIYSDSSHFGKKITIMCRCYKLKQARLESHLVYGRRPGKGHHLLAKCNSSSLTLNCSLCGSKREAASLPKHDTNWALEAVKSRSRHPFPLCLRHLVANRHRGA